MRDGSRLQRFDERLPQPVQFRPQRARGEFMLGRGDLDRHHHVALDLDGPHAHRLGDLRVPSLLDREVAAVEHEERRGLGEIDGDLGRRGLAHHEPDAPPVEPRLRVRQSLEQEGVVPGVGLGEPARAVEEPEAGDHRQAEAVCLVDRKFQRRVEAGAVGLLHQVEDVAPVGAGLGVVENPDPLALHRHARRPPCPSVALGAARLKTQTVS